MGRTKVTFLICGICGNEIAGTDISYKLPINKDEVEYWQSYHPECLEKQGLKDV